MWSRSSRSHFGGMEDTLSLNGDVRTTMLEPDYRRGPLIVGLSVGRTLGLRGYGGQSAGQMTTSMTGFYPWLGNDRVSVWGVTGYGTGALSLTPDGAPALDTGMSMAMTAAGTRGELIGSRTSGGFALAFKADALWVGAATELVDGRAGRLNASQAKVTRVRTALEGSRGFHRGRPGVADAKRGDPAAAGRRRRRDRHGHGHQQRSRLLGYDDRTVAGRAGADAGGAPGRGVLRTGRVGVCELEPDAVDAAAVLGAGGALGGGQAAGGAQALWGSGNDGGNGARRLRTGQPSRWRGRLRVAGGDSLRRYAAGRLRDLGVRPGLPGRRRHRRARPRFVSGRTPPIPTPTRCRTAGAHHGGASSGRRRKRRYAGGLQTRTVQSRSLCA